MEELIIKTNNKTAYYTAHIFTKHKMLVVELYKMAFESALKEDQQLSIPPLKDQLNSCGFNIPGLLYDAGFFKRNTLTNEGVDPVLTVSVMHISIENQLLVNYMFKNGQSYTLDELTEITDSAKAVIDCILENSTYVNNNFVINSI